MPRRLAVAQKNARVFAESELWIATEHECEMTSEANMLIMLDDKNSL